MSLSSSQLHLPLTCTLLSPLSLLVKLFLLPLVLLSEGGIGGEEPYRITSRSIKSIVSSIGGSADSFVTDQDISWYLLLLCFSTSFSSSPSRPPLAEVVSAKTVNTFKSRIDRYPRRDRGE